MRARRAIVSILCWTLLLLAGCVPAAPTEDPDMQAAADACRGLEEGKEYDCIERYAVQSLNPEICRLAGIATDDMCLQAVYEAAADPAICERIYLEGVRPTCRAYYERVATSSAAALPTATPTLAATDADAVTPPGPDQPSPTAPPAPTTTPVTAPSASAPPPSPTPTVLASPSPTQTIASTPVSTATATLLAAPTPAATPLVGDQLRQVAELERGADTLDFSDDGTLLAGGSAQGEVHVWNTESWTELWTGEHASAVRKVAFSPTGDRLGSVSFDNSAHLWDAQSGQQIARLDYDYWTYGLDFSGDGFFWATGSLDTMAIVARADNGDIVGEFDHELMVADLALSPNGPWLASMTAGSWGPVELVVWDIFTHERRTLARFDGLACHSNVAYSPDTRWLAASMSFGDPITIWQTETWPEVAHLPVPGGCVRKLAFSPDGRRIGAIVTVGEQGDTVVVWDVNTWRRIAEMQPGDVVWDLAFSPDADWLLLGLGQGIEYPALNEGQLWEIDSGSLVAHMTHDRQVLAVAFSPAGHLLATGSNGTVKVWELPEEGLADRIPGPTGDTTGSSLINRAANVRSGPGTNYDVVGQARSGERVRVVARSENGSWLQVLFSEGATGWMAAYLIDNVPAGVPLSAQIPPTPTPPLVPPAPSPTWTVPAPAPQQPTQPPDPTDPPPTSPTQTPPAADVTPTLRPTNTPAPPASPMPTPMPPTPASTLLDTDTPQPTDAASPTPTAEPSPTPTATRRPP